MTALVWLHGFTGRAGGLAAVAPAIELPLLGHGGPAATGESTFAGEVDRLAAEIAALAPGPVHLGGYSMGARLALAVAARHPALIARLTLVGVHPGLTDEDERARRREADEALCRLLEERGIAAFVAAWEALPLWQSQGRLPAETLAAQRQARLAHDPRQLAAALRAAGLAAMPEHWQALGRLQVPVDLVAGELDHRFRELAERALPRLARGRLVVIPGAGHNPILERPRAVAELVGRSASVIHASQGAEP